ncbi:MAG: DUF3108 domain-containing protein [Kiritimatiellaceae bacterium]|nr:DUF3108 domain-containing protein [Kiritimatiellaceae bacterium]
MLKFIHSRSSRFIIRCSAVLLFAGSAAAGGLPFPLNERLDYRISWNGILVAWSTSTTGMIETNGTNYVFVRVETQTYPIFDVFYRVNDLHECLLDPETLLPVRFEKNMREGRSRYHDVTTFDYANGVARFENVGAGTVTNVPISADTRDYLSFMYFMRGQELTPGKTTTHHVLADDKVYEVLVHAGEIEKIGLSNYPDVPSLQLDPEAAFNGLFVRCGKATLWVSRDPRRLLTCMKAWVPFGRVTVRLNDVSGDGNDFWITKKENDVKNEN